MKQKSASTRRKAHDSYRLPTEVFDEFWLRTERRKPKSYPQATERCGKWLLFVPVEEIDEWWVRIKEATENGLLGSSAKVATMKPNQNAISDETKVICVYTYDVEDDADCNRVRRALRDLGVTWRIHYKTDAATYAGKYSRSGARVSARSE